MWKPEKRLLTCLLVTALLLSAMPLAGAAPEAYLIVDPMLAKLTKNTSSAFVSLSEEQQNAAMVLLSAKLITEQQAAAEPDPDVAQSAIDKAGDNEVYHLAASVWTDSGTQYVVPSCEEQNGLMLLTLQDDEYVQVIQKDDDGQWAAMPQVSGQTVALPPSALFIYSYPHDDDVMAQTISRTLSAESGGYEDNSSQSFTDPEFEKMWCGHRPGTPGKHGRYKVCGRFACEKGHEGTEHKYASCGIVGHFTCDGKTHQAGVCTGDRRKSAPDKDKLEACGNIYHLKGEGGDHSLHAICGKYMCSGKHTIPNCGNNQHCVQDGKKHGDAPCDSNRHFLCDGKEHIAASCRMDHHWACDGLDHSPCGATPKPATPVPTEEPTEEPTEKPTPKPTKKPTEKPTQKPTEKPAEEPPEKPADPPPEQQDPPSE